MSQVFGNNTLRIGKGILGQFERNTVLCLVLLAFSLIPLK